MASLAAELDTEEQDVLIKVKAFYKELEKLSKAPPDSPKNDLEERLDLELYDFVAENDQPMQLLITDAFAKSKWKRIHVVVNDDWRYQNGSETTLINAIFRGLSRNAFVEAICVRTTGSGDLPLSTPCLPPNLRELDIKGFYFDDDAANNRKGLPELIQHHQHLKRLELSFCDVCPKSLAKALSLNKSVNYLSLETCLCSVKVFFDSMNNNGALETIVLSGYDYDEDFDDTFGVCGIEALHRALKEQRLKLRELGLEACLGEDEMQAVIRMLADYTKIKKLNLVGNDLGDDELQALVPSLQNNPELESFSLPHARDNNAKSADIIKDFIRSKPDGTLERVRVPYWRHWTGLQEEVDTLLDINKFKPLVRENRGVPLSVLQHERLDCTYFYIRSKPDVCLPGTRAKEHPRKRQKTHHEGTSDS